MKEPDFSESNKIWEEMQKVHAAGLEAAKPFEARYAQLRKDYIAQRDKETLAAVESGYLRVHFPTIVDLISDINAGYFGEGPECLGSSAVLAKYICAFCLFADGGDGNFSWPGCTLKKGTPEKSHVCEIMRKNVPDALIKAWIESAKTSKGGYWRE